jgi:hypothetical protein
VAQPHKNLWRYLKYPALLLLLLLCGAGYAFASFLFVALSSTELADIYVRACACGSAVVLGTFLVQYLALTLIPFGLPWVVALLLCATPALSVAVLARYCTSPDRVTATDLNQWQRSSGHSHHFDWD